MDIPLSSQGIEGVSAAAMEMMAASVRVLLPGPA